MILKKGWKISKHSTELIYLKFFVGAWVNLRKPNPLKAFLYNIYKLLVVSISRVFKNTNVRVSMETVLRFVKLKYTCKRVLRVCVPVY